MAWSDPGDFTSGQILTAAQMDSVREAMFFGQATFTNEAARDTAYGAGLSPITLQEGMRAYLTAPTVPAATGGTTAVPSGIMTVYNGSAWVCVTPVYAFTSNAGTTTSGTYTATLSGSPGTNPSVTLSTGTTALVSHQALIKTNNTGQGAVQSVAVSGAGTVAASDNWYIYNEIANYVMCSFTTVITGLTAGNNTFTLQYRQGSATTTTVINRSLTVCGIA